VTRRVRLADDLAVALADEPDGLACRVLAWRLHRRKTAVLSALRGDSRFVHGGRTCGSRWRLAAERPARGHQTAGEQTRDEAEASHYPRTST
jgi:hypothetical protein